MRVLLLTCTMVILTTSVLAENEDLLPWWREEGLADPGRMLEADCLLYDRQNPRPRPVLLRQEMIDDITGIPLSRHHVIPGRTLTRFFNLALDRNDEQNNQLRALLNVIRMLSDNAMNYYDGNDQISQHVRWHLSNIQLTTLSVHHFYEHVEVPMDSLYDARDLARSLFFWMPANIFIGPRHRADDPGHHFEVNARFIMQDDATFAVLRNINNAMDDYLRTENVADFNRAIELLVNFLPGARVEPYPFNIDQWIADHQGMVDGIMRHFYRINPNPQIRPYYMKRGVTNAFYQKDPLCILPEIYYEMALKQDDLVIAATVLERTENATGFKKKYSYGSWREWLEASSWRDGIFSYGIAGYGKNMAEDKYGYYFYDKSFVAGLKGTDLSFGKDSWTNNHNWEVNSFGGQMYFDKNGRPVALAVSDRVDKGWLYYYTERKWKILTNDNIVEALASVLPNGRTESMDTKAMRFPAKKIKITPDDGRELRSADNRK